MVGTGRRLGVSASSLSVDGPGARVAHGIVSTRYGRQVRGSSNLRGRYGVAERVLELHNPRVVLDPETNEAPPGRGG